MLIDLSGLGGAHGAWRVVVGAGEEALRGDEAPGLRAG